MSTEHEYDYGHEPAILDVRIPPFTSSSTAIGLLNDIRCGLVRAPGARSIPTMLLYDARGLRIYDELTEHCKEYYLFGEEEGILKAQSGKIVETMTRGGDGAVVVELGAGSLRKTSHLLLALAGLAPITKSTAPYTYYALDLELSELQRTLSLLHTAHGKELAGKVDARGMWGTYDGGIAFIEKGGLDVDVTDEVRDEESEEGERGRRVMRGINIAEAKMCTSIPRSSTPPLSVSSSAAPSESSSTPITTPSASPSRALSSERNNGDCTYEKLDDTYGAGGTNEAGDGRISHPPSVSFSPPAERLRMSEHPPLHLLFLGSSLGNLRRAAAPPFLASLPLRPGPSDTLLLGLDNRNEKWRVENAYGDAAGWTAAFCMNGLRGAGRVVNGEEGGVWALEGWEYSHRYDVDEGRHEAYYRAKTPKTIVLPPDNTTVHIAAGEEVNFEYSYKYSAADAARLFALSALRPIASFPSPTPNTLGHPLYTLYLLERPAFHFPLLPSLSPPASAHSFTPNPVDSSLAARSSTGGMPTLDEWTELWKCWDTITLGMIPQHMLHTKPIDLRHKCLFYLGHIPAFLDIHLVRMLGEEHTEPVYFKDIFERGIDPNVEDPTQCHDHSIVPERDEDWPNLHQILSFCHRVRARVARLYADLDAGNVQRTRKVARMLGMTFEHEIMHAETLLYMLSQSLGTLPPPGFAVPDFALVSQHWNAPRYETLVLGPCQIELGHDDRESDDANRELDETYEFGWDNESPVRLARVDKIRVEVAPVTNGEYRAWWEKDKKRRVMPASWVMVDTEIHVRSLYGPVSFAHATHWPVQASQDDLSAFAASKGGRLPSEAELRLFLDTTDAGELANVGFKNWHPVPPYWDEQENKGHNGGVWEWTTTKLDAHAGFVTSVLYPGYSSDFHDGHHYVALGGSYATHPRIAQRRSFRNWYQHNYAYAWIGGRVVYDG